MAIKVWVGTDSGNEGDWDTDANWETSTGGSTVAPVDDDDVFFVSGSQSVTSGFDQSLIELDSLNFGTKWSGSIETALQIDSTVVDYANTTGTVILEGTYVTVNVQSTSSDNPALTLSSSTVTNLRITGGNGTCKIASGTTVSSTIDMIGSSNAVLEIVSGSTVSAANLTIDDGRVTSYEELNSVVQYGGTVTIKTAAGTIGTVTLYKGTMKYQPTADVTLTTLVVYSGYFDMRGCPAPTHTIVDSTIYSGGMIDERNGLANATFTNPILSNGGVFMPDLGRSITVT